MLYVATVQTWIFDDWISGEIEWTAVLPGKNRDWRKDPLIKSIFAACDGGTRRLEDWVDKSSGAVNRGGRRWTPGKGIPACRRRRGGGGHRPAAAADSAAARRAAGCEGHSPCPRTRTSRQTCAPGRARLPSRHMQYNLDKRLVMGSSTKAVASGNADATPQKRLATMFATWFATIASVAADSAAAAAAVDWPLPSPATATATATAAGDGTRSVAATVDSRVRIHVSVLVTSQENEIPASPLSLQVVRFHRLRCQYFRQVFFSAQPKDRFESDWQCKSAKGLSKSIFVGTRKIVNYP